MIEIKCEDCISRNVCQYKELFKSTKVTSNHPYLLVTCTEYHSTVIKPPIADYAEIIRQWRILNPNSKKMTCHKETGISRPTIDIYWNGGNIDDNLDKNM